MRINKYIAENSELSRRKADEAIKNGRVKINGNLARLGDTVSSNDELTIDGNIVKVENKKIVTILLNKPVGYVCSKDGQGSKTVYDLLPEEYKELNIAGRLDKDSSGLVVMTNDGILLNELTHPSNNKEKIYEVEIDSELSAYEQSQLKNGVDIGDDRPSSFKEVENIGPKTYKVVLEEGRNRQIRRSFEALGFKVTGLKRIKIGKYELDKLKEKEITII
jgi:23S rRNA pseudouridine2605 synthase